LIAAQYRQNIADNYSKSNCLINSGKTLTKREREAVERHIEAHSERISIKELNDMKCLAAIRKRSKYGPYG